MATSLMTAEEIRALNGLDAKEEKITFESWQEYGEGLLEEFEEFAARVAVWTKKGNDLEECEWSKARHFFFKFNARLAGK